MEIARTRSRLAELLESRRRDGIGFVPTMGALHSGHMSLVSRARLENDTIVVSVFVNPTQFNDPDDLKNYPRTEEADARLLEMAGADIVFMPTPDEIYPEPDTRVFDFGLLDKVMEGATRPGHFNGVAQVVSRLFDLVKPARAYFGEKDFQQMAIIRKMVADMGYGIEIVGCPIVRDTDGLASSSRNTLLDVQRRAAAPKIYAALSEGIALKSTMSPAEVEKAVAEKIDGDPLLKTIYCKIVDSDTLEDAADWNGSRRGCVAVQVGDVRLIDNVDFS